MSLPRMTKEELAEAAGYSYRQLYNINKKLPDDEKLFNEGKDRKCDLAFFVQQWVNYNVANEATDDADLNVVKAKHEAVKMKKTQLEVKRMQGQLVDVQDVKRLWGDLFNMIKQNLLHMADKLAPMLQGVEDVEERQYIMHEEIRKLLEGSAEAPLPDYAAEQDGEEDTEDDEEV